MLLFPGLDALFQTSKLQRWLEISEARRGLDEASTYLSKLTGQDEDLALFLKSHSRHHIKDFDRTLVMLTALQVGIARGLREKFHWDILLGCSHGDIARSVVAGVISFEHAVGVLWKFSELRKKCPEGYAASVRPVEGKLTQNYIDWLEEQGAPVSLWSEGQATIAGSTKLMTELAITGREKGLKIKPVLQYPVHSPSMQPVVTELIQSLHLWTVQKPNCPVFSSVTVEYLNEPEEIVKEALAGAVSAVKWTESIAHLYEKENVTKFINVGPCNSLTGWMLESDLLAGATLVDSWDSLA